MRAELTTEPESPLANIIPLTVEKSKRLAKKAPQRFKLQEFENRSGSKSWRVTGMKRDGQRVRENFAEVEGAQCRQIELETEYLRGHAETTIRATKLSAEQVQLAEVAFLKLGDDWQRILDAVDHWKHHGKNQAVGESPRMDDAFTQFVAWMDSKECKLRDESRGGLKTRINIFANSIGNFRVNQITIETVEKFLDKLDVASVTKDNYRRAISRFFSWCIQRPRRWATVNPCREIRIEKGETKPPSILSVEECGAVLSAATAQGLAPYVALCLFGGLRPFEAGRLDWQAINLKDREIRLEGTQTKTGRPRVVAICDTLAKWLKAYEGKPIVPANFRRRFDAVKVAAGFVGRVTEGKDLKPWPADVLRHSAISHYFRATGSYGKAAEQFGNSEAIIKRHYQGRVTSDETKKFYALMPKKAGVK